jgi:hypothetical protein
MEISSCGNDVASAIAVIFAAPLRCMNGLTDA